MLDPIQLVGEAELDILLFSVMVMRPKNEVTLQNWLNPNLYVYLNVKFLFLEKMDFGEESTNHDMF